MNDLKRKAKTRLVISGAILLVTALCLIGVTVARLKKNSVTNSVTFEYSFSADAVHILKSGAGGAPVESGGVYEAPGAWNRVSDDKTEYSLSFLLSNAASSTSVAQYDETCMIEVFVTDGAPSAFTVKLAADGTERTGIPETVTEGSALYQAYGAGRVYRFLNAAGEPYTWDLPGGSAAFIPMTLTASGNGADHAALTVIASGIPSNNH